MDFMTSATVDEEIMNRKKKTDKNSNPRSEAALVEKSMGQDLEGHRFKYMNTEVVYGGRIKFVQD